MWFVIIVQVVLSLALLIALFVTLVWLRSSAKDGKETQRLIQKLSTAFYQGHGDKYPDPATAALAPVNARQGGVDAPPISLRSMTDTQRTAGLTVAMKLPTIERRVVSVTRDDDEVHTRSTTHVDTPVTLSVKTGDEVVNLDADTVARIESLRDDVNAGRLDGTLLQRVISAGFTAAGEGARASGEVTRSDRESDEEFTRVMGQGDRATTPDPIDVAPVTRPTGR